MVSGVRNFRTCSKLMQFHVYFATVRSAISKTTENHWQNAMAMQVELLVIFCIVHRTSALTRTMLLSPCLVVSRRGRRFKNLLNLQNHFRNLRSDRQVKMPPLRRSEMLKRNRRVKINGWKLKSKTYRRNRKRRKLLLRHWIKSWKKRRYGGMANSELIRLPLL